MLGNLLLGLSGAPASSRPWWIKPGSVVHMDFERRLYAKLGRQIARDDLLTTSRPSTAWAEDSAGNIQTFAANEPRIADKGLLVWEEAENISIAVSSTANRDATKLPNQTDITGTSTAVKVVEDAVTSGHGIRHTAPGWTDGEVYTASVYAKAGERSVFTLLLFGEPSYNSAHFDLLSGQAQAGGQALAGFDFGIEPAADGWYRCWVSGQVDTESGAGYYDYRMSDLVGSFSGLPAAGDGYLGDGSSGMYFCYPNCTKGLLSPPILTTGVVPADNITVDLSGIDFSAGVYGVMDFEILGSTSSLYGFVFELKGAGDARLYVFSSGENKETLSLNFLNGDGVGGLPPAIDTPSGVVRQGFGWAESYLAWARDGSIATSTSADYVSSGFHTLFLGISSLGGNVGDILVKRFTLYSGTPTTEILTELAGAS